MISASLAPQPAVANAEPRSRMGFGLTPRALLLLLAGTLWLIPAFFLPRIAWGMAAWDLVLVAAILLDAFHLPNPKEIQAERIWLNAPALAVETGVEIALTQQGGGSLRCMVTDDLTAALVHTMPAIEIRLYPTGRCTARYTFEARERGDHTTGKLYLRYRSLSLGLLDRWAVADLTQRLRVYPAIHRGAEQDLFLTRSKQIELQQRMHRHRGLGRDFESLRDYREGDDLRDLCWTATARRGTPITRLYQTEKSQPVWLLMDAGRLMQTRISDATLNRYTRLDAATTTALALAQLALFSGDRVGLLAYGSTIQQRVALNRGAPQLRQLMEALAQVRGEPGEADHLHATITLNRMQPRRSLILWITDMAETSMRPEVVDGAVHLMRRHLVLFVAMRQTGLIKMAARQPEERGEMFQIAAAQELIQRRAVLMAQLRNQGALTVETDPEHLTGAVLNRYLEVKEKGLL